jgi:hypothetical protein
VGDEMNECSKNTPKVVVLDVPKVHGVTNAIVLEDVAHKAQQIGVVRNALLVGLEVKYVHSIEPNGCHSSSSFSSFFLLFHSTHRMRVTNSLMSDSVTWVLDVV